MKKILGIVAGVAALGGLAYMGNELWAQAPAQQPLNTAAASAPPQVTRVGTLNMILVIKGYKKFDTYRNELKNMAKPFEDQDKKLRDNMNAWAAAAQNPKLSEKEREDAANNVKTLKRQIEDNGIAASKLINTKNEEQIVQIYKEIEDAVKAYSRANGIHLVMMHSEPIDEPQVYAPLNIQRKLVGMDKAATATPMYVAPGLDISQAIVSLLNSRYQPAAAPTAPAGQ